MSEKLNQGQRALLLVEALSADVLGGLSNKQLASKLDVPHYTVSKDLTLMEADGWAEQLKNGNWRLRPRISQVAAKVAQQYEEEVIRLKYEKKTYLGGQNE